MGVSAPAPPLSFLQVGRDVLSVASLSVRLVLGVLLRHLRGIYYRKKVGKSQAMGLVEGLTMQRQSRSPRANPSTRTSAVAILLAKGMLF